VSERIETNLGEYDNSWYKPGNSFKRCCWYIINSVFFKSSLFPFSKLKVLLLQLFGASAGKNILIKPCVNIKYPWFLSVGNNVWIGEKVWIDNLGKVVIGNNVCLSQESMLLSGNHDYTQTGFNLIVKEIILEDGVWIGARSVVCGGVVCRNHAVLAVNSVATRDLEPFSVYQGNPAQKVKER